MPDHRPLMPGATLGVLGGGQLGRMFVQAAQRLGYQTEVYDPDPHSPAGAVAHRHRAADYGDVAALDAFAADCDAVTIEFENVPTQAVRRIAQLRPVSPSAEALGVCQDRAQEKAHFERAGVACVPHRRIESAHDLQAVPQNLLPGILKTARLGYDGKGQVLVADRAALAPAWESLGKVPCLLEQRVPLAAELSVVLARGADGAVVLEPVFGNRHAQGILAVTELPASIEPQQVAQAEGAARRLAETLDYVGVLCVEFFVLADGSLLANEMAPRPHNSGHATLEATDCSQFELQVRAMARLPLVTPRLVQPAVMLNLLGDAWWPASQHARAEAPTPPREPDWPRVLAWPGVHLHLYGKREPRPGRKMGHLTVTAESLPQARALAHRVATALGLPAAALV
jgi:5-(carboxyamino)imidazole ribonucleotide synthase